MKEYVKATPLIMLVLAVALMGGLAWGEEPFGKTDKHLAALGQKIDRAATPADSSRVTARIVDEWSGTKFTFDANSAPRSLTVQDVENLRAQGLGFGEISILLGLTANQPNPLTAKSLNEILALRQSGQGWGQLARELGYKNLGLVVKSVKATEKDVIHVARPGSPAEQRQAIRLQAAAARLDAKAAAASSTPRGTQRVVSRLAREFKVPESTVTTLREQKKLGFGDIAIALGLAQEEAKREKISLAVAIDRIVARRATGAGWGQIANDLGLKLGKVVSEVKEVDKGLAAVQKPEAGRPEKMEKPEKSAKPDQVEKLERPAPSAWWRTWISPTPSSARRRERTSTTRSAGASARPTWWHSRSRYSGSSTAPRRSPQGRTIRWSSASARSTRSSRQ